MLSRVDQSRTSLTHTLHCNIRFRNMQNYQSKSSHFVTSLRSISHQSQKFAIIALSIYDDLELIRIVPSMSVVYRGSINVLMLPW